MTRVVIPFLRSLGSVALIGGAIRDVARAGRDGFASDLDFVVYGSERDDFAARMECLGGSRNKFGGYGLHCFRTKVDVWHIEDTWAKTAGLVRVIEPSDLLRCTFFDWDSALYEIDSGKLLLPSDYLERLQLNVMDIRLEENPNKIGSLVRALRRAALWGVKFGPRLTAFSKKYLQEIPWDELVALDSRAFFKPVLRSLDRVRILEHLDTPISSPTGEVTYPVPDWMQPRLSWGNESPADTCAAHSRNWVSQLRLPWGDESSSRA
ncbi:MAG TPA: hypothetical protein VNM90_07595, partial [Haliangium sp.]|nr:hypothetical protein [Haliangium sp.]